MVLAVGWIMCTPACELTSETWEGRPTAPGKMLFDYVDEYIDEALFAMQTAATFGEYYRQTSEEARREVRERYFRAKQLAVEGDMWFVIGYGVVEWSIEIKEGLGLENPDAEWSMVGRSGTRAVITPDAEGGFNCLIKPRGGQTSGESEWQVASAFDKRKYTLSVKGNGWMEWRKRPPLLRISYTIPEPIVYDSEARIAIAGRLAMESSSTGKENETAEASYGADGSVWIGYQSSGEWWDRNDKRYYGGGEYD